MIGRSKRRKIVKRSKRSMSNSCSISRLCWEKETRLRKKKV